MRIQPIYEVNTNRQQNPFYIKNAGSPMAGKSTSQISFEDYLRAQLPDLRVPAMTRKAESPTSKTRKKRQMRRGETAESPEQKHEGSGFDRVF